MKPMTFRRVGGVQQLEVSDAEDLCAIDAVHLARWAATSAPLRGLHCDPRFLEHLDSEQTGRIRASQLVEARDWLFERLSGRKSLGEAGDVLRLGDLDQSQASGRRLCQAAEHVLEQLDAVDRSRLGLGQVQTFRAGYARTLANGDGIVPPEVIPEPEVAQLARDILAVAGGAVDASGWLGVGQAELGRFLERGQAYLQWKAAPAADPAILPWGEETAAAAELVLGLDAKLEEYFWNCDLMRQEPQAAGQLQAGAEEVKALQAQGPAAIERYLAAAPLATPAGNGQLPLGRGVNPYYQERFEKLGSRVLARALGAEAAELTRASWGGVKLLFEPYFTWRARRPAEPFEMLEDGVLEAHLAGPGQERLRHHIAVDLAAAGELEQVEDLEKLILYQRWLLELANNFVSFSAIYHPRQTALVEMGTLIVDGRSLELCLKVEEREAHKKVASASLILLVYAAVSASDEKQPAFEIVAPVTSGNRGRLRPGKRGLFIDLLNREWDARIVDVVENPITLAEAVRAPFRRAWAFTVEKLEALSGPPAEVEGPAEERHGEGMELEAAVPGLPDSPATVAKAVVPGGRGSMGLQGLLLGGGVAFAAIGSTLAYLMSALAQVSLFRMFGAAASVAGAVVLLSALVGWLKLRRRDLAPLLEASGWAVNARMRLTRRLERLFTRVPALPRGSARPGGRVLGAFLEEELAASRRGRRRRRWMLWLLGLAAVAAAVLWLWLGLRPLLKP